MKDKADKIIEEAKKVSLTIDEKNLMRARLDDFMRSSPISNKLITSEEFFGETISKGMSIMMWFRQTHFVVPAMALFLLVTGGGTSILAKHSLPGDTLYPIKININEKVESVLTLNTKESALVDLKQASTRLLEAEILADKGDITPEQNDYIQNNFSKDVDSMNVNLSLLENSGDLDSATEVRSKFEANLLDHVDILSKVTGKSTSTANNISNIITLAKTRKDKNSKSLIALASQKDATVTGVVVAMNSQSTNENDLDRRKMDSKDNEVDTSNTIAPTVMLMSLEATTTVNSFTATSTVFTMVQVSTHNSTSSCYTVIKGSVYNLTKWISGYKGGAEAILSLCGKDGTLLFEAQHMPDQDPEAILKELKIGVIAK